MHSNYIHTLLNSNQNERKKAINNLINSERNAYLDVIRKYYEGHHWHVSPDGLTNQTTSGKNIWGKNRTNNGASKDPYERNVRGKREVGFSPGQLQTKNYIKRFIQIYQDFIVGKEKKDVSITYNPEIDTSIDDLELIQQSRQIRDNINKELNILWKDIDIFFKEQVAKMVLNTVSVTKLTYDFTNKKYKIKIEDAKEIFPFYDDSDTITCVIKAYSIDAITANMFEGVNVNDNKFTCYAQAYYYNYDDKNWYYVEIVDGFITNPDGKPEKLIEELNFNPFSIVSNLDHPFRSFTPNTLEDSEIFDWIEKNDTLNAQSTIEYLTNLFLASPKVSLDLEQLDKMGIDPNDAAVKSALEAFQYSAFTIDTLPIKVQQGNGIPESFYRGLDITKQSLFEDASIPMFLASGNIPSGIAVETIELGMLMLSKKIDQKRQQLIKSIREISIRYLKQKGLVKTIESETIEVTMPPVNSLSLSEQIKTMQDLTVNQILPSKYVREEMLKLLNRYEDLEKVRDIENREGALLRQEIEQRTNIIRSQREAEATIEREQREREELNQIQNRINEIENE